MKRPGLTSALIAATLFVATGLRAESPKDAALAAVPAPSPAVAASGPTAADAMKSIGTDDILGHLDQIEAANVAVARESAARDGGKGPMGGMGAGMGPGQNPANPAAAAAFRGKMLEMFDKNGDGKLDDGERAEARKYAADHGMAGGGTGDGSAVREQMIKRFDKNGDGKLDAQEAAAMQKFVQERQAKMAQTAKPANASNAAARQQAKADKIAADLAQRRAESLAKAEKKEP